MEPCSSSRAPTSRASSSGRTTGRNPSWRSARPGGSRTPRHVHTVQLLRDRRDGYRSRVRRHRAGPAALRRARKQTRQRLSARSASPARQSRAAACVQHRFFHGCVVARAAAAISIRERGPLNVFGPYSDTYGAMDLARGRSVPAIFRDAHGVTRLFVTGNTKKEAASTTNVAPSLARLKIMTGPGGTAWLAVDQLERTLVFENPGSAVVTSNGPRDAVVWVLDPNARRSALSSARARRNRCCMRWMR